MDVHTEEAIMYITAGLCTFLAIICSYRWLLGRSKKTKEEEKKADKKIEKEEESKDEDKVEDKEEEDNKTVGCPFSFLMSKAEKMTEVENSPSNDDDIGDLLIDSSEILPVQKDMLTEGGEMVNHKKVKDLEEEVIQSMTDEQLDEERNARQAQLEAIFKLMQNNKETFGMSSVDDVQNQYKLYV